MEWDDNSVNEDGFEISSGEISTTVSTDVTSYTWSDLESDTRICFEIRTFNTAGTSAFTTGDSPNDGCATTRATDSENRSSSGGATGTAADNDPTSSVGTAAEDDATSEESEGVVGEVTGAVDDTFQALRVGELPETGGG